MQTIVMVAIQIYMMQYNPGVSGVYFDLMYQFEYNTHLCVLKWYKLNSDQPWM